MSSPGSGVWSNAIGEGCVFAESFESVVDPVLDELFRDIENFGDFRARQTLSVSEKQHFSLFDGK